MGAPAETSMVDITSKPEALRTATAKGLIHLRKDTLRMIREGKVEKGDVFTTAKLAAVNAVKRASEMVFLAHPIPITDIQVILKVLEEESAVKTVVTVKSIARTGVELEALVGVMAALLNVFDMCKPLEKDVEGQYPNTAITDIKVVSKFKTPLR